MTLAFAQARALLRTFDEDHDIDSATARFDTWCEGNIRPWFDDHRQVDADRVRRWGGGAIDLTRPLPSDLIVAAAEADPGLRPLVEPYAAMTALPESLAPAEARARAYQAVDAIQYEHGFHRRDIGWRELERA